jgi:ABC-type bacteriocin/lantibiotic exporter with double-glycine peptidase domain
MTAAQQPQALSVGTLSQLAAITGTAFDVDRAQRAVQNARENSDPLSQLVSAAAEVSMKVSPVRLPLAEVVWLARQDAAVALWCAAESRWLVVTSADWFKVRIAQDNHPRERITISRGALAQRLGLSNPSQTVEAGIVHPKLPAQALRGEDSSVSYGADGGSKGGAGYGLLSPGRRFLELLEAERQHISTLLIFSFFSGLLYLAAPLAVDAVVSRLAFGGQSQPYVQALVILTAALLGCISLQAVMSGFQYYLSEVIQRRIFVRAATDLAYRLPRVKAEAVDEVHTPELVNRFLEVVTAQKSTSILLLDGVNVVIGSLAGMLLLAFYHPALLALVAVLISLLLVVIWPLGRGAVRTSIYESKVKYELVHWFEQIAAFPLLFRGPGGLDLASEHANHLASQYLEKRGSHFKVVLKQVSGLLILSVSASAAVLLLGGWLVLNQQLTIGQLAASELIMGGIAGALAKFGKKLEAWYDLMAAMDKLGNLFDLEIERDSGERPARSERGMTIQAKDLGFGLQGLRTLFANRSFTIPAGSRTAVVGAYGSGCSSLLDLFFGLRAPTSGHLSIDGLDVRSWHLDALREEVLLLRGFEIVPGSVIENLRLGNHAIGLDEIRAALSAVGILDSILLRPEGLELELQSGGAPLSGNERVRLLLARALVQKPRLLLLDELIDGMDEGTVTVFAESILCASLPWTVVIASRDPAVTRLCGQVIQLGAHSISAENPS